MSAITQILLSGYGGQGVVLAGVLLGQAGVLDGKVVAGSNSYGAQARGSGCKAEVVFSEEPIDFPHVITADILVALSQGGYEQYRRMVKETAGLILYDHGSVRPVGDLPMRQIGIAATDEAIRTLKAPQSANLVMLGALIGVCRPVSSKAMEKAIALQIPERFRKINLAALRSGLRLGETVHG
jgi:2-oxoglutarate ferredoxin oxidoreductase subunit gamma